MASKLRSASWMLLTFEAVVIGVFSLVSTWTAYGGQSYPIAGVAVEEVAAQREGLEIGLRATRGTAAAFSAAFAVLMLGTAIGPYRAGSAASWWALLASLLCLSTLIAWRIPTLGTTAGTATAWGLLGLGVVALLLDVGRLRQG